MRQKIIQMIQESHQRATTNNLVFNGGTSVLIVNPLPDNIDIKSILFNVEKMIPSYLMHNLDAIYVGKFEDLERRQINAKFADNAIYITNDQDNNEDMLDDLVHEVAHLVESNYGADIYADGEIEREFLSKRKKLGRLLKHRGYETQRHNFTNPDYDTDFDFFLYKDVGYKALQGIVMGLFVSPYAATSLREYFAKGFEDYYLNHGNFIKKISPALYKKISHINNLEENF